MQVLKVFIERVLGKNLVILGRGLFRGILGYLSALRFGLPGRKLKLIAVTGTKGKTSVVVYIGRLLNLLGYKSGYISSALINTGNFSGDGGQSDLLTLGEVRNPNKLTTPDPYILEAYLDDMVENGSDFAVVEMSSQGLEQNRNWGIGKIKCGVFLNLYPEHLDAHGGIENYRSSKAKLFKYIKPNGIFVSVLRDNESQFMWNSTPEAYRGTIKRVVIEESGVVIKDENGRFFLEYERKKYELPVFARFEAENLLTSAIVVYNLLNSELNEMVKLGDILSELPEIGLIPGRMQWVVRKGKVMGNNAPAESGIAVSILVDYAHEPESMRKLLQTCRSFKDRGEIDYVIHVVSSDGGGRDNWKKPILGELSYEYADFSVVTTDNYDKRDNPQEIINRLIERLPESTLEQKYTTRVNREDAFEVALNKTWQLITENKSVLVVSTGVGAEAGLYQPWGIKPWDEARVWQESFLKHISRS